MSSNHDPFETDDDREAFPEAEPWEVPEEHQERASSLDGAAPPGCSELATDWDDGSREEDLPDGSALNCAYCSRQIGDIYFFVNDEYTCAYCREVFGAATTAGSPPLRFLGATSVGALAALISGGFCLWLMVSFGSPQGVSNIGFAFLAVPTGFFVGTAVYMGCAKRGGWLYQLIAMGLTYCAIVTMYIPSVHQILQGEQAGEASATAPTPSESKESSSLSQDDGGVEDERLPSWKEMDTAQSVIYCGALYVVSLFGPVMSLFAVGEDWRNAIYFLAAMVAVGVAWYKNQRIKIVVTGPYETLESDAPEPPA